MYDQTWIIVANGSCARFFKAVSNIEMNEYDAMINPEIREKTEKLFTDKPGKRAEKGASAHHHVGTPRESYKEQEMKQFAISIASKLKQLVNDGDLKSLYCVVSPHFLGILSKKLDPTVAKLIKDKVNKDLTSHSPKEIRDHLPLVL